jgi:hypothetical protein
MKSKRDSERTLPYTAASMVARPVAIRESRPLLAAVLYAILQQKLRAAPQVQPHPSS